MYFLIKRAGGRDPSGFIEMQLGLLGSCRGIWNPIQRSLHFVNGGLARVVRRCQQLLWRGIRLAGVWMGVGVVVAWLRAGSRLVVEWLWRGFWCGLAVAWLPCGCGAGVARLSSGVGSVWLPLWPCCGWGEEERKRSEKGWM